MIGLIIKIQEKRTEDFLCEVVVEPKNFRALEEGATRLEKRVQETLIQAAKMATLPLAPYEEHYSRQRRPHPFSDLELALGPLAATKADP